MRLRQTIKRNARLALSRHWCKASGITVILLLFWAFSSTVQQLALGLFNVSGFTDIFATPDFALDDIPDISPAAIAISALGALFALLVINPLKLGAKNWYYRLTDGVDLPAAEIFGFFFSLKKYFGAVFFTALLFLKKLFWSVIFLIVPLCAVIGGYVWENRSSRDVELLLSTGLKVSGFISFFAMSLLLMIWIQRYYLAEYLFAGDECPSPLIAIRRSVTLTNGRLFEFFLLEMSLIGFRALDALILPKLYTTPYISVVQSLYTRYLSELFAREEAACSQESDCEQADSEPTESADSAEESELTVSASPDNTDNNVSDSDE